MYCLLLCIRDEKWYSEKNPGIERVHGSVQWWKLEWIAK